MRVGQAQQGAGRGLKMKTLVMVYVHPVNTA